MKTSLDKEQHRAAPASAPAMRQQALTSSLGDNSPRVAQLKKLQAALSGSPIVQRQAVAQRMLEIANIKKCFSSQQDAESYLTAEYTKSVNRAMNGPELKRMKELAESATSKRYVYPIDELAQALAYIASGQAIQVERRDLTPGLTPERDTDDATPWNFVLYKNHGLPSRLEVPQSPTHETFFPTETNYEPEYVDMSADVLAVRDDIKKWDKLAIAATHKGNNHYAYSLEIKYRLDELESVNNLDKSVSYLAASRSERFSSTRQSPYYTSKKKFPPQAKGEKPVDMEKDMRQELTYLHTHYDRDRYKEVSLYAVDKETNVRTKDAAHYKKATNKQLGSLYYHSEVQAASDHEVAKGMAQKAVQQLVHEAVLAARGANSYNLVVTAVIVKGYSEDRTVCGGACKPALAHLSELIGTEVTAQLHSNRENILVKDANIFIRRSAKFTASAHVGAGKTFQGLETGAQVTTEQPGRLQHNRVSEYKPS